jgi:hypothetical protein
MVSPGPREVRALAVDYDGTVARNGRLPAPTAQALSRARAAGCAVLLVTGRILDDLRQVCPEADELFDVIVAENGAVVYRPAERRTDALGPPPEPSLVAALERRGVEFRLGRVIVATWSRFGPEVSAALAETGVHRTLAFNKDALMLLPVGIDKGSGLRAALSWLAVPARAAVAIGDAENDGPLLAAAGWGVAVADAVPDLRARADHVTRAPGSQGVLEFLEEFVLARR